MLSRHALLPTGNCLTLYHCLPPHTLISLPLPPPPVCMAQDLVAKRGEGTWVWTTDGRKLLDMTSGEGRRVCGCVTF